MEKIRSISWRRYPKVRQKEFLDALKEKKSIRGVKQEAVVEAQWYKVLNYCFADYSKNKSKNRSGPLSKSVSNFYAAKEDNFNNHDEDGQYATHMEKLLDTDGLMFVNNITVALNLIAEFKDDVKMDVRLEQEKILGQVILYLKHIQQHIENGNKLHLEMPNVVLAADVDQAFVVNARVLYPYLDLDIDWDKYTPRGFYDNLEPREILEKLTNDQNINPYIYDINSKDFDVNDIIGLAADLASTSLDKNLRKIPVNQANIRGVYDEFLRLVTQDKTKVASDQELVSMFINALTDHESFVLKNNTAFLIHDEDGKNAITTKYRVNGRNWYAFFSRFDTNYTSDEIKNITAVGDVLLKETVRRFSGEYWTPTIWTNEAIKTLDQTLGEDWKDKYYVWDCAAGSKNLTRDFKFKNLYSSSLYENELELGQMYNRDNVAFQYDFLNDDVEYQEIKKEGEKKVKKIYTDLTPENIKDSKLYKLAPDLAEALLEKKPIVFYTNPPYGTSGNTVNKKSKTGIADTIVHKFMLRDGISHASENLYCQFYYRIIMLMKSFGLKDVVIAYFSNSQFMGSGSYFANLKKSIFTNFKFLDGFLLNAGEFAGTASTWGISFTILKSDGTKQKVPKNIPLKVKETTIDGIKTITTHVIRDINNEDSLLNWVKSIDLKEKYADVRDSTVLVTGPFTASKAKAKIYYPDEAIGYVWLKGNNVEYGLRETGLFSADYSRERGTGVVKENFERAMIAFAVRRAVKHNWIINKDSFRKPNSAFETSPNKKTIIADMVVYSLFDKQSKQSSIKEIEYLGKTYQIKNNFFWLDKEFMKQLADKYYFSAMGFDIDDDSNRYVYKWLQENKEYLSEEAKKVIYASKKVIEDTFRFRIDLDDEPKYSFGSWDAGWVQIIKLMKFSKKPDSYKDLFIPSYNNLKEKINGYVYKYGFLEK